jgi:hypothetical protein
MKEIAIKQTWPGQSEKCVTVFVNGRTKPLLVFLAPLR